MVFFKVLISYGHLSTLLDSCKVFWCRNYGGDWGAKGNLLGTNGTTLFSICTVVQERVYFAKSEHYSSR